MKTRKFGRAGKAAISLPALIAVAIVFMCGAAGAYAGSDISAQADSERVSFEENGRYDIAFTPFRNPDTTRLYQDLEVTVYDRNNNVLAEAFDGMADESVKWDTKDYILDFDGSKADRIEFRCYYDYMDSEGGSWTGTLSDTVDFGEFSGAEVRGVPVSAVGEFAPPFINMGICSVSTAPYHVVPEKVYNTKGAYIGSFSLSGIFDPKYGEAFPGEKVTVTFNPDSLYHIRGIRIGEGDENLITADGDVFEFVMPARDIGVESAGLAGIPYIDPGVKSGDKTKYCYDYEYVEDGLGSKKFVTLTDGWYVVGKAEKAFTYSRRITTVGNVNLILCDGCDMYAREGIEVDFFAAGNGRETSLTVWGQSGNTGKLRAEACHFDSEHDALGRAVIGSSRNQYAGAITINGGTVTADAHSSNYQAGSDLPPAIGGGVGKSAGFSSVTINGGIVTASTGTVAPGIGGGKYSADCGDVTINGGDVTARGGGAGIGGWIINTELEEDKWRSQEFGHIRINGGTVRATGLMYPGLGGCGTEDESSIVIKGGNVTASGGRYSAGIGAYQDRSDFGVSIEGGTVNASGGGQGAGISASRIVIKGGNVTANGGEYAAGIGANRVDYSYDVKDISISISGCTVTANGGKNAAGIGSAYRMAQAGDISIKGSKVTATGGDHGAGVGTGEEGILNGNITVDGNELKAYGGAYAAGTGSGYKGTVNGSLLFKNGKTESTGGEYGAGIGRGSNESPVGSINIEGGSVTARGGAYGAGIGGGYHGICSELLIRGNNTVVNAFGGKNAAGIGGGDGEDQGNRITVESGTVTAKGGEYGAGIGGGDWNRGNEVIIKGGSVTANGGLNAAGIGGGNGGGGGKLRVEGGNVKTSGGDAAAGIGSGEMVPAGDELEVKDAEFVITGGRVEAYGLDGAAGIGGGVGNKGIDVSLLGGTTIAHSGGHGKYSAIGASPTSSASSMYYGRLEISGGLCVRYQNDIYRSDFAPKKDRVKACRDHYEVHVFPCKHEKKHYEEAEKTHTMICELCETTKTDPHDPGEVQRLDEILPTCTEQGSYTALINCKICGHEVFRGPETTAPLGHDYEIERVEAGCEEAGHETGVCKRCAYEYMEEFPATGHDWDEWKVVKPAGSYTSGEEQRVCKNDESHVDKRVIPPTAHVHSMSEHPEKAATCTEAGNIHYWSCRSCGGMYSDQSGKNAVSAAEVTIPAAGHSWNEGVITREPGCTTEGLKELTCTVCEAKSEERIHPTGHSASTEDEDPVWEEQEIREASCSHQGYVLRTLRCRNCSEIMTRLLVPVEKLPHSWDSGKVTKEPTADSEGERIYSCTVCGETRTEAIPKLKPADDPGNGNAAKKYTPAKVKLTKVTKGKKRVTLKWKRVKNVSGYQIQVISKKSGRVVRTVNVKQTKKLAKKKSISRTVKKLGKKKKYKLRVRAYINAGGSTFYGKWSKAKSVKTR